MLLLTELVLILRDLALGVWHFLTGRRRRRYEHSIRISAPPEIVWEIVRSRDIAFDGMVPMRMVTTVDPHRPDIERSEVTIGEAKLVIMLRIVEERPNQAVQYEILEEGSSPQVIAGRGDFMTIVLHEHAGKTQLTGSRELEPLGWAGAVTTPMSLRSGVRRYKAAAEKLAAAEAGGLQAGEAGAAGAPLAPASSLGLTPNGILLAVLALASFSYLWGWERALLIAGIIILHEVGHALAMIMVGIPVKGIYLVPFVGGAAIAAMPYRTEAQVGFVALMGPGFSIVPTLAFFYAANEGGHPLMMQAAFLSAIINLLNLVPILPLDGGHVLRSVLVSFSRQVARMAGILGGVLGLWLAWQVGDPVIGVLAALGLLFSVTTKYGGAQSPMSWSAAALLLATYVGTAVIYIALLGTVVPLPRLS